MQIRIKDKLETEDIEQLCSYLKKAYRSDIAIASPKILQWQLGCTYPGLITMMGAFAGESLIGILGYLPVKIFWGDFSAPQQGCYAMNWHVDKSWRSGAGWAMIRKLTSLFDIVISLDFTLDNAQLTSILGWKLSNEVSRLVFVLDNCIYRNLNERTSSTISSVNTIAYSNLELKEMHDNWNLILSNYDLDWPSYSGLKYGVMRDSQFLAWRYLNHPVYKYEIRVKGHLNRYAVCVFRIELATGVFEGKVARIVEFFHPTDTQGEKDAAELIADLLSDFTQKNILFADVFISSSIYKNTLLKSGWISDPDEVSKFPTKLTPVVLGSQGFNAQYHCKPGREFPTFDNLYLTKGDSDADRVTSSVFVL